jgi:hypothetical protein
MKRKVTPAERFRQGLMDAVAGAGESFSGYCRLAAQAMLQAAMEHEAAEFIGRASYQRREPDQAAYRSGYKRRPAKAPSSCACRRRATGPSRFRRASWTPTGGAAKRSKR